MVLNIPLDLRELLGRSVLCSPAAAYIPFSLANIADIESYQLGYRIDGPAGEDLTNWEEGEWLPSWLVIGQWDGDPYFVDMTEGEADYPIYTSVHGEGSWEAEEFGCTFVEWIRTLECLLVEAKRQAATDIEQIHAQRSSFDISRSFLEEWLESLLEWAQCSAEERPPLGLDFRTYQLVLTDAGPNRIKVLKIVRERLQLAPTAAKELLEREEAPVIGTGTKEDLQPLRDLLEEHGAKSVYQLTDADIEMP